MNIVYIHRSLTVIGGLERILVDKMSFLAEKYNYNIWFITYEQCNRPFIYNLSDKVHHIDIDIPVYKKYKMNIIKSFFYYKKMHKLFVEKINNIIEQNNINIVVGTTYDYLVLDVLNSLRSNIVTIIETHTSKKNINESHVLFSSNKIKKITYKYYDYTIERFIKKAKAFVTLTADDAKEWRKIRKCIIIPNFLKYYPTEEHDYDAEFKHVISVGRLSPQKGYDILLKSWSYVHLKHTDWHLDIYGEGEDHDSLNKIINDLNMRNCITIHKPTMNIYEKYAQSDFYVLPSRCEGFGIVLIEAMSSGLPCVAFDCEYGPSEIIKDNVDGVLVDKNNILLLAKKLCYLIENKEIRINMGKNARENVKRYLPENVLPIWKHLFESLLNKN